MLRKISACLLALTLTTPLAYASAYDNFYITYMSPAAVNVAVKYAASKGVHHVILWTVDQDAPQTGNNSLINAINQADSSVIVDTYFPNYAAYNNQRALPGASYNIMTTGSPATLNPDLKAKLSATNSLIYAFAETQVPTTPTSDAPIDDNYINTPYSYGAVYLYDPWSDLAPNDVFCGKNPGISNYPVDGNGYNLICSYAFANKGKPYDTGADYNHYGNFSAFAKLPAQVKGKGGQPQGTYLSIGGFDHNATFEAIFDPATYGVKDITTAQATGNFVNSIVNILTHYQLDGVDLDYENVQMTVQQSQQYLALLTALNNALQPLHKFITLPIISNPDYIAGTESGGTIGFAPGVLAKIAALSQVKYINAMTYDFSGTFNYDVASGTGVTGFLSNTYIPNDPAKPSDYHFSIEQALDAMLNANVPASKVGIGVPAYGRALSSLPSSSTDASYLFSQLDQNEVIPAGDQDVSGCDSKIVNWANTNACQGMFSYNYIVKNMLGVSGVVATDHVDDAAAAVNGTTAFALHWTPAATPSYTLTIINQNTASGQLAVGDFNTAGYIATGTHVYGPTTQPSTASIEGQTNLPVTFTYWKQTVSCGTADFTRNLTINISADPVPVCTVQAARAR